jgi:hypothetical protein
VPNLVDTSDPEKYGVAGGVLIPILVKAIQELTECGKRLENR